MSSIYPRNRDGIIKFSDLGWEKIFGVTPGWNFYLSDLRFNANLTSLPAYSPTLSPEALTFTAKKSEELYNQAKAAPHYFLQISKKIGEEYYRLCKVGLWNRFPEYRGNLYAQISSSTQILLEPGTEIWAQLYQAPNHESYQPDFADSLLGDKLFISYNGFELPSGAAFDAPIWYELAAIAQQKSLQLPNGANKWALKSIDSNPNNIYYRWAATGLADTIGPNLEAEYVEAVGGRTLYYWSDSPQRLMLKIWVGG